MKYLSIRTTEFALLTPEQAAAVLPILQEALFCTREYVKGEFVYTESDKAKVEVSLVLDDFVYVFSEAGDDPAEEEEVPHDFP